jgi:hypothetical protein
MLRLWVSIFFLSSFGLCVRASDTAVVFEMEGQQDQAQTIQVKRALYTGLLLCVRLSFVSLRRASEQTATVGCLHPLKHLSPPLLCSMLVPSLTKTLQALQAKIAKLERTVAGLKVPRASSLATLWQNSSVLRRVHFWVSLPLREKAKRRGLSFLSLNLKLLLVHTFHSSKSFAFVACALEARG